MQVNALFRRVTENEEWGSGFKTVVGSEGLAAGRDDRRRSSSDPSSATRAAISRGRRCCRTRHFVDAKVELFAKYASTQWVLIGTYPIERKLLTK